MCRRCRAWWGHARRHLESPGSAPAHWRGLRWWRTIQAFQEDGPVDVVHPRKNWPRQVSVLEAWMWDEVFDRALDRMGWRRSREEFVAWCAEAHPRGVPCAPSSGPRRGTPAEKTPPGKLPRTNTANDGVLQKLLTLSNRCSGRGICCHGCSRRRNLFFPVISSLLFPAFSVACRTVENQVFEDACRFAPNSTLKSESRGERSEWEEQIAPMVYLARKPAWGVPGRPGNLRSRLWAAPGRPPDLPPKTARSICPPKSLPRALCGGAGPPAQSLERGRSEFWPEKGPSASDLVENWCFLWVCPRG